MSERRDEQSWEALGDLMRLIKNEKALAELAVDAPFTLEHSLRVDRALVMHDGEE